MLRCAILDDYQNAALSMADWSVLSHQLETVVFSEPFQDQQHLINTLQDFEVVVLMRERTPFPAAVIAGLPRLRLLVTTGMRNASIDLQAAQRQGVVVCGTHSFSEPPLELSWALILGLARQLQREIPNFQQAGPWQSTVGFDLHGQTLGLLGLGKIGVQMARVGQAFGMQVMAWSQNLTPERAAAAGVQLASDKMHLLEHSDVVSLHLVLSERTRGLLGRPELQRMKPTALLINTSRAGLIDQEALMEALQQGWIAGAGLDVFEQEPLPPSHPLRTLPNVLATPHLGYVTKRNYQRYFSDVVEDLQAYLAGSPIRVLPAAPSR